MRRLTALLLLTLLFTFTALSQKQGDLSLDISLTRGERSRDSHSQTTHLMLKGNELIYEKSYRGARGGMKSQPVKKRFKLKNEELEELKKLVRDQDLLISDAVAIAGEVSGVRRYFELSLNINLDGKKSEIEISGPRSAAEIKEQKAYQKAYALLDALYKILATRDKEIPYENRDLIEASR